MQEKIGLVILMVLIFSGCSVEKRITGNITQTSGKRATAVVKSSYDKNLTADGFFIHKGRISTSGEAGRINLVFTMKYLPGDKYLISIRSKTGVEAFRVYLNKDTVLINDRINRVVLYGGLHDFERIAGIPADLLKVSIGDLFFSSPVIREDERCVDNEIRIEEYYMGLMVKSVISCISMKTKSVLITTGVPDEFITIDYNKNRDDIHGVPRKVEINDFRRKIKITIAIDKFTSPWVGEIEFVPGSGYDLKPLI